MNNRTEIVFLNHFGHRSHAQIVEQLPEGIDPEKRFQGEIDGYEIYSKSSLIETAFDYVAIKKEETR